MEGPEEETQRNKTMAEGAPKVEMEKTMWTTWEELLLACAVKRHGLKDWESVAMELQTRSSVNPLVLTPQACRNKYADLKRRFTENRDDEIDTTIPWLEDLRKLRVAELKQEVQRYDLSIQSLQSKVKRLEDERERSSQKNEIADEKPDPDTENRSENDKTVGDRTSPEDGENRSFNESNSTGGEKAGLKDESREEPETDEPVRAVGDDSCDGSSDTVAVARHNSSKPGSKNKTGNSAVESKEGTKESSEVQSTASLTKRKRRKPVAGGDEPVVSPASNQGKTMKSEPLVGVLDIIRSHQYGSVFERRLDSQKTDKYKKTIRKHMDLKMVQTRLDDGSYSSSPVSFYRDLLLLFTNAILFYPKASQESLAAHELRCVFLKETKKSRFQKPDPQPEPKPAPALPKPQAPKPDTQGPESVLVKHNKSSAPIVVCRKRSSISAAKTSSKPEPSSSSAKQQRSSSSAKEEEESLTKTKTKEKPVTGARSLRRGNRNRATPTTSPTTRAVVVGSGANNEHNSNNNKNANTFTSSKTDLVNNEGSKEKRKGEETTMAAKKRGAADFLKRIKKNTSPAKGSGTGSGTTLLERLKNDGNNRRRSEKKERKMMKEEISPSKKNVGRPPKKGRGGGEDEPVAVNVVPSKRGREKEREREGGEGGEGNSLKGGRPNKRLKR